MTTANKNIQDIYPLSPIQRGMLFHSMAEPGTGVYVPQYVIEINGEFNAEHFKAAWKALIERHPVLRTVFMRLDQEKPLQVVLAERAVPFNELDWRMLGAEKEQMFSEWVEKRWLEGFDVTTPDLMDLTLIHWDEQTYRFIWTHHHAQTDGWSTPILFSELLRIYQGLCDGQPANLPPITPYKNYIAWLGKQDRQHTLDYWQNYLSGATFGGTLPMQKPMERTTQTLAAEHHSSYGLSLNTEISRNIKQLAASAKVTVNAVVQTLWAYLLTRYLGTEQIVIGATVSGRPAELAGVESMVGQFINTVPVRFDFNYSEQNDTTDTTVEQLLALTHKNYSAAESHAYLSLLDIKQAANLSAEHELFHYLLVFENFPDNGIADLAPKGLQFNTLSSVSHNNYALTLVAFDGEQLSFKFKYDPARLTLAMVEDIAAHFNTLLSGFAEIDTAQLSSTPVSALRVAEQPALPVNETTSELSPVFSSLPQSLLHHATQGAENSAESIAIVSEEGEWTYQQLLASVNQFAHFLTDVLADVGVEFADDALPSHRVGIMLPRCRDNIVAMLATQMLGLSYVPIDTKAPNGRIARIIDDAQLAVIVTQSQWLEALVSTEMPSVELVVMERDRDEIDDYPTDAITQTLTDEQRAEREAYVIYTSGTTGTPKGVPITHASICHYSQAVCERLQLDASASLTALSTMAADLGYTAVYGALVTGRTLRVLPEACQLDADLLAQTLTAAPVDCLKIVPSHLQALLAQAGANALPQQVLVLGGEAASAQLLNDIKTLKPQLRIMNHYGPTEATVGVLCGELHSLHSAASDNIPLGKPLAGVTAQVLDSRQQAIPFGAIGELYVAGPTLSTGYLHQAEQTDKAFLRVPQSSLALGQPEAEPVRMYRTGDLVRYLADGQLCFVGRADQQVKVRGYRIELEEIRQVLAQHDSVSGAVVFVDDETASVVACVVVNEDDADAVIAHSNQQLMDYMQPQYWHWLDELPVTANGKIDMRALQALHQEITAEGEGRRYVEAVTDTEQMLVKVWSELIGVAQLCVSKKLFAQGGNSLLLIRAHGVLKQQGYDVTVVDLFRYPNIQQLAAFLDEQKPAEGQAND